MKLVIEIRSVGAIEEVGLPVALQNCEVLQVGLSKRKIKGDREGDSGDHSLSLHADLVQDLGLVAGMKLGFWQHGKTLVLGPVIGVFMSKGRVRDLRNAEPRPWVTALVGANRHIGCLLYFFTIGDLDWEAGQVQGTYYDYLQETWRTNAFPIFTVLYDRGIGFTPGQSESRRQLRGEVKQHPAIKQINCIHYFDKWDQCSKLAKITSMQVNLPYTRKGRLKNLKYLLEKFDPIYVKGCLGSSGLEVMRVEKWHDGFAHFHVDQAGREVEGVAASISELWRTIENFLGSKRFIVQQGIQVLKYNGHNLDFRLLMQRDEIGAWRLTDTSVRVSITGAISSTRSGSSVYQLRQACSDLLAMPENQIDELQVRLHAFGMTAVAALETAYGRFGELGIDVALDNNSKIWFIEANAKPSNNTVLLAAKAEIVDLAFARPLLYSRYLAGFPVNTRALKKA